MAKKIPIDISDHQALVNELADFIELRFGVYLDTIMGFELNLDDFECRQLDVSKTLKVPLEDLDKTLLIRSNSPPSPDLEECQRRTIHRMTQASFKKNNNPGGANYDFAIENCLSDIFNYWKIIKEKLGLKEVDDIHVFPITAYMRDLRNRLQHDLYGKRAVTSKKGTIQTEKTITSYPFPTFKVGQPILLSVKDIEAIVFEVRAQFESCLIPYMNNSLQS